MTSTAGIYSETDDRALASRTPHALIDQILSSAPPHIIASNALLAGAVTALHWGRPNWTEALIWLVAMIATAYVNIRITRFYFAHRERVLTPEEWLNVIALCPFLGGLAWGAGAFVLYDPAMWAPGVTALIAAILVATFVAIGQPGALRFQVACILPSLLPVAAKAGLTGQPLLASGLLIFTATLVLLAWSQKTAVKAALQLRLRNDALIDELRRRESELTETLHRAKLSEARLASTIEQFDEPFVLWGPGGDLISCNAVARQLFRGAPPTLHPSIALAALPTYLFGPSAGQLRPLAGHEGEAGSFDATFDDGRTFHFTLRRAESGDVKVAGMDLTDARAREEALLATMEKLRAAKEQAESASRAKSTFLAHMSHELRTPLNAILGFSEIIREGMFGPVDTRYASYAADIHSSGSHLLELINTVLDLSKIEAGKLELDEQDVDLSEVVRSALRLVRTRGNGPHLLLRMDMSHDVPLLRADPRAVTQMLLNLLSNAVKFTPAGGSVTVSARADSRGIVLMVSDTGIGIAERDLPKVFAPFGQVASPLGPRAPGTGTGLGVPLVKSLVELHGGNLHIESLPNAGTTVSLVFPPERMILR